MDKPKKIIIYGLKKTIAIPTETGDTSYLENGTRVSNLQLEAIDPKLEARLVKTESVDLLQTMIGVHDITTLDLVDLPIREDVEVEIVEEENQEVGLVKRQVVKKKAKDEAKKESKEEVKVEDEKA